jgi:hypothetical protein
MHNGKNGTLKYFMTVENNKTQNISNFIGVYDNYITDEMCQYTIDLFENQSSFNQTMNRKDSENAPLLSKNDEQFFAEAGNIDVWHSTLRPLIFNFEMALKHYENATDVREAFDVPSFHYTNLKIQKTLPTQGYHVWHLEHNVGYDNEPRALVFSIYLNDVEDGGETEFLHFSKRVKPKKGRIVIWPASFPYLHRGNPPLSGNKYLLTSWMLLR